MTTLSPIVSMEVYEVRHRKQWSKTWRRCYEVEATLADGSRRLAARFTSRQRAEAFSNDWSNFIYHADDRFPQRNWWPSIAWGPAGQPHLVVTSIIDETL